MLRTIGKTVAALAVLTIAGSALAQISPAPKPGAGQAVATFAGGCFWCMEEAFEKVGGVASVTSGFMGGTVANPTYRQVSGGNTGHAEAIQVIFDPKKVTYQQLVDWFWSNVDPVDKAGQFCDKGTEYRSAIFYQNDEQKRIAEASKAKLEASGRFKQPIATEIDAAGPFYPAEDYHQGYYEKNPVRYKYYKHGCQRTARLEEIWGKPTAPPTQ